MKRVLFVDDDDSILHGLENLFRRYRQRWELVFTLGPRAAVAALEAGSFDVVVSDMRMPGMDGAELLTHVKRVSPRTARVILTGQAERDSLSRALPVSHRILGKPCNAALMREVIESLTALDPGSFSDPTVPDVLGSLDQLPCSRWSLRTLHHAVTAPYASLESLAVAAERDGAIAAKALQLANSALVDVDGPVTSVRDAVARLGASGLVAILHGAEAHLREREAESDAHEDALRSHRERALLVAELARHFVEDDALQDEAFAAGLLADVGVALEPALALGQREHAATGAYVLSLWGLPPSIVDAVLHHHAPSGSSRPPNDVLAAVHVAAAVAEADGRSGVIGSLDESYLDRAGVAEAVASWLAMSSELLEDVRARNREEMRP